MIDQSKIIELEQNEIDNVTGGNVGAAALGAAAAVVGVAVASFEIGLGIGRSIGKAIFRNK